MSTTDSAVLGPPPTQEKSRRQYAGKEIRDLFRGDEERHRRLHGRLLAILLLSLALDVAIASVLTVVDTASGVGGAFPKALIWTTSQTSLAALRSLSLLGSGTSLRCSCRSTW